MIPTRSPTPFGSDPGLPVECRNVRLGNGDPHGKTFEIIEKAWSHNTGPYAEAMHRISKVVVTNTLRGPLPWNATALPGDAAQSVAELKRRPGGDILMYGSFTLMRTLLRHGLIDELVLGVHPVVIGTGTRLFDSGLPHPLRLVDATPTPTGVVAITYAP